MSPYLFAPWPVLQGASVLSQFQWEQYQLKEVGVAVAWAGLFGLYCVDGWLDVDDKIADNTVNNRKGGGAVRVWVWVWVWVWAWVCQGVGGQVRQEHSAR